jgi:hypothetical protein
MTLRECAIITAHTGIFMGQLEEFYKYINEIMERPVYTHELADSQIVAEIKKRSEADFIKLNEDAVING